ncbi:fibronectin type III domain-containing protein [Niabella ginsengisoli]|uniref:Fibronectin type III domain-containing protein n=1 Tax=Niabella ginsengisoli TaxID=522298 RepID=A0ABS9SIH2_9BACT|nr:fibronectin type III domain-containing protein [Niabella ginsengisoli]MCH5597964.1 fibronectin type III domain-containing protein [Niabella ginsengisoli]
MLTKTISRQLQRKGKLITIFLLLSITALAQNPQRPVKPQIQVKASVNDKKDAIMLRWAASNPASWRLSNKYGFIVERFTVLEQGKIQQDFDRKILTPQPLKPAPAKDWEADIEKDDNAAIIAQALYGEGFEVSGGESKLATIVNKSAEQEQRFTFSLMAADRSFEASIKAGWGFVDTTVAPGGKYFYKIYTVVPLNLLKIDTAVVFMGLQDAEPLPKPKDLYAVFGDQSAMLTWDYKLLKDVYTAYYIEKSTDSINFSRISDIPVVNMNEKEGRTPNSMYYVDSLANNETDYYYRVRGITIFGETSPPSDTVQGRGKKVVAFVPNIESTEILNDSTVKLNWDFPTEGTPYLDHFEVELSPNGSKGTFKVMVPNVTPNARSFVVDNLLASNYFVITAVGKDDVRRSSFPAFVQPVDSIPPSIPTGLAATVDTLGNVSVFWKANPENDLLGYTILKTNSIKEEPAVINSEPYKKICIAKS